MQTNNLMALCSINTNYKIKRKGCGEKVDDEGFDPSTSCMLSIRSTN